MIMQHRTYKNTIDFRPHSDEMEILVKSIVDSAQTSYDGGVIGNILKNVKLWNNSNINNEVRYYLTSLRVSGGYLTGLIFGALWIISMVLIMTVLCVAYFRGPKFICCRHQIVKTSKLFSSKKGKDKKISHHVALVAMVLLVLLLLCFSVANVVSLNRSIGESARPFEPNKTGKVSSLLPATVMSLWKLRQFLSTIATNADAETVDIVDEMITATRTMQTNTMEQFNSVLMGRIGVSRTFQLGDEMTRVVLLLLDRATDIVTTRRTYDDLHDELYPTAMERATGVFHFVKNLRDSVTLLPHCDPRCRNVTAMFARNFIPVKAFADTDFASSFIFVMRQRNETRASVQAKGDHGRRQMAERIASTQRRLDSLVDVASMIRNVTASGWAKMDHQVQDSITVIDGIISELTKDSTSSVASYLSYIFSAVLVMPLLLALVVVVLAVALLLKQTEHDRLRIAVYASFSLLSISLLAVTTTFLVGGNLETELCRYIRTQQPLIVNVTEPALVLDQYINKLIPDAIKRLPKSDNPVPSPRNVLYGLLHRCSANEPILAAMSALHNIDVSALNKPETSEKMVAIGRRVLLDSLNETDAKKMMPADMQDTLKQAIQMDMFQKIDVDANSERIPRSPLLEMRGNVSQTIPMNEFNDGVDRYIQEFGGLLKDGEKLQQLKKEYKELLILFERFKLVTDKTKDLIRGIKDIPKVEPVVNDLQVSLEAMIALMDNKTQLLAIAEQYYNTYIVKTAPENAANIIKEFGPKMLARLGRCQPLFEAYELTVDIVCNVIVPKVNKYWLYLGTMVLLLTLFLAMVFLSTVRRTPYLSATSDRQVDSESKTSALKLLDGLPNGDQEEPPERT